MNDAVLKEQSSTRSTFFEQMLEHVFVSEVLQEAKFRYEKEVEVLRSEIDNRGYDLVLECNGVLRHVQLKGSYHESKTAKQNVHQDLATKPNGCVVWYVWRVDAETRRIELSYLYFGEEPGRVLDLSGFPVAKHTKGNAQGEKKERPAIREVSKKHFQRMETIGALMEKLFGLSEAPKSVASLPRTGT